MSRSIRCLLCVVWLLVIPDLALSQKKTASGPTLSSISPTSAAAGTAGLTLTLAGTNFTSGSLVLWNGVSLTSTFVNATQVKATVPSTLLTVAGTVSISVYAPGRWGGNSNALAFTISPSSAPAVMQSYPLAITTTSVPNGTAGTAYSATLAASGGVTPYTWSVSSGTLPAGLTLAASTGAISGTPTTSGSSSFMATVKDSVSGTASYTYSMNIGASTQTTSILTISTTSPLPNGTAGTAYSATLGASGGTSPYTWSVASGSTLPAGLTLATTGALSGTPTTAATYGFSLQTTDSANNAATQTYSLTIAAATTTSTSTLSTYCNSTYGPCGDPYEGSGGPPANATPITACGTLSPMTGQYYLVKNDLGSSSTLGSTCLSASYVPHFTLDLGGRNVNGVIVINTNNLSGQIIFNGVLNCSVPSGCIQINGADTPSAQARIHHIAVNQAGSQGYAVFVAWQPGATGTPVPGFRMDHIGGSGVPPNQPSVNRTNFLYFTGPFVGLDADYNNLILPNTAAGCQGIVAMEAPWSTIHDNFIQMGDPMSISGDSCRGIILDSEGKFGVAGTGGGSQVYNNLIFAGQNRAVRVRAETGDVIYNNTINDVNLGGRLAAIHIGECDVATEAASAEVYGNLFYMNGGNAVVATGSPNISANVHDNTVACYNGNCAAAGYFALTDALFSGYNGANLTVTNNNVSALGTAPAVKVCGTNGTNSAYYCSIATAMTTANQCVTGNVIGQGIINLVTSAPCP